MKNIIDFTRMRPNKKSHLIKCPECGKVGKLHKYTDGTASISHKGKIEFGFLSITEHCYLKE